MNKMMLLDQNNIKNYIQPLGTILSSTIHNGNFNKASSHRLWGFDITFSYSYSFLSDNVNSYNFVIPDDSITYNFPFKFPKSYILRNEDISDELESQLLNHIFDANSENNLQYNNSGLFQDFNIPIRLALNNLLYIPNGQQLPTIFGDTNKTSLIFDFNSEIGGDVLYDQIIDSIWTEIKNIEGIGKQLEIFNKNTNMQIFTSDASFSSRDEFKEIFASQEALRDTIENQMESMDIMLNIPGGSGYSSSKSSIALPILQGSIGLPFHTEISGRFLPKLNIESLGALQFGSIGGKIDISKHINDLLNYEPFYLEVLDLSSYPQIFSDQIDYEDVTIAIDDFKAYKIDIELLDSLNNQFKNGDTLVIDQIQAFIKRTIVKNRHMDRVQVSNDSDQLKAPFDLSLGYYYSYYKLDLGEPEIYSSNGMISMQLGKAYYTNTESWLAIIPFLKSLNLYLGLGFESSKINLDYTYTDFYNNSSKASLSYRGENSFKCLLGVRLKLLKIDTFLDYNMGSTNSLNFGFGINL